LILSADELAVVVDTPDGAVGADEIVVGAAFCFEADDEHAAAARRSTDRSSTTGRERIITTASHA
jgi:hypothetical protein